MKYTIKWESNGKKVLIIWEKYEHQFAIFSPYDEFCWIFLYYGKLMGKPIHVPYDEVYVGCESCEEKSPILWGKYEYQFPRFTSYEGFCCIFPHYEKLMGKRMQFPYDEVYH